MESLALAIALCCPCLPTEIRVEVTPAETTVTVEQRRRRHPTVAVLKAVGKAVNHLRPFHGRRRGC